MLHTGQEPNGRSDDPAGVVPSPLPAGTAVLAPVDGGSWANPGQAPLEIVFARLALATATVSRP